MRGLAVVFALLSAVDVACAADLPVTPPVAPATAPVAQVYDWTGFYIGVNGGWEFQQVSETTTTPIAGGATSSSNTNAAVAGGQMGFNWQVDRAVFGIEGDFDWSGQHTTRIVGTVTNTSRGPWFATIRGRFGAAFDRLLIYGTAGAAFLDVSQNITATGFGTVFNASQVDYGWTAGAGVEDAFAQNWTARVEYLFVDADLSLSGAFTGVGTLSHSGTITRNMVRGGINYKF